MEVFLPRRAQHHWTYSRHETSSQRMETEAPITMVMAIGDETNRSKKQIAEGQVIQYKRRLSSLTTAQLLRTEFKVLDFMSFVDYGDGLCLPAEVGVAGSCLEELEKRSVYSGIPNIPYHNQRVGFASDSMTSCERIHGIDMLDNRSSKLHLTELCDELKGEVPENTLLLCRSEDLIRVLGSWYWLQDSVPGNRLPNIAVMLIEDFLVQTLTQLHLLNGVVDGGVPTFSQFTTLLSSSQNDLNLDYRCHYHNTEELAWNKPGCARKNAIKYLGIISDCLSSQIAQSKNAVQPCPATIPIPGPAAVPTARGMLPAAVPTARGMLPRTAHGTTTSTALGAVSTSPRLHSNGSARSNKTVNTYTEREGEPGRHSPYSSQSTVSVDKGRRSAPLDSSPDSSKTSSDTSRKGRRGNPTRLLSPQFFAVPSKSSSSNSASDDTTSSRSVSPISASQPSTSPYDVPSTTPVCQPSSVTLLPPRRPDKSFSRRNYKKVSEETDNHLPSAGSTNLPGLHPPHSETTGEVSVSTSGDICLPRRPRSYNNRSKGSGKGNPENLSDLTYDGNCGVTSVKLPPVMGNVEKKRGTRSGTSTVPSDTVLVPSSTSTAAGLSLQFNHSTTESTVSQMTPPPGFDPIPQYAAVPPGFIVTLLPSRINRAALNYSSSEEEDAAPHGNSADRTQSVHKPAKKRGRN